MGRKEYLEKWHKENPDYHKQYWESQKKERACVICGASYMSVRESQTCSPKCRGQLKTARYTKLLMCEICGKEFRRSFGNLKSGRDKTCSNECRWKRHGKIMSGENHPQWRDAKEEFTCVICGEVFKRYKSDNQQKNKTCSVECKYIFISRALSGENHYLWVGGRDSYRGAGWQRIRGDILERDNYTCQDCGKTAEEELVDVGRDLSVHHIIPFRFFSDNYEKANRPENLVTLCASCHMGQEGHRRKEVDKSCPK